MASLEISKKTVAQILSDRASVFLIPDYQRPYSWEEDQCATLWDDLFDFAFPGRNKDNFDSQNATYFLGPIVTFKNQKGKMEIIDGQQRLTTLLLLLRAFYAKFGQTRDSSSEKLQRDIADCIWKKDELGNTDFRSLKIASEVATDSAKEEFTTILESGIAKNGFKSKYAQNFRFFKEKIDVFLNEFGCGGYFPYFPARIMNNCVLLPIESDSQDMALRIFSTLNDRGLPLSDADIFKAQFYKHFTSLGEKNSFISRWKDLEEETEAIFSPSTGTPMDELFTRYMYVERAKVGNKSSTTEGLRRFYEKDGYALLRKKVTFDNLELLASFWNDVARLDQTRFSDEVIKRLFVLRFAPNGMWANLASVYFMNKKDSANLLDNRAFCAFLDKTIAFTYAQTVVHPGLNALRTPVFSEMVELSQGGDVTFKDFCFNESEVNNAFANFKFVNNRPITKSILVWWAFQFVEQNTLLGTTLDIEHIYARKRAEQEPITDGLLESLGNKAVLESRINIRASDYRFADKKRYYSGFKTKKNQEKFGTSNVELRQLATVKYDFTENDIRERNATIIDAFIRFLGENRLLQSRRKGNIE